MRGNLVVIGYRGQVTIPKCIRELEGLKPRDKVVFRVENGNILLEKFSKLQKERLLKEYYSKYENLERSCCKWMGTSK